MTEERVDDYWEFDNHPMLGKKAKDFSTIDGFENVINYTSSNKHPTILHFGNLTCMGSLQAFSSLERLRKEIPDVEIVHVAIDKFDVYEDVVFYEEDSLKVIIDFGRDTVTVHLPIYKLPKELQEQYEISSFSTALLVDTTGVIKAVSKGSTRLIRDSLMNYYPQKLKN